MGIRAEVKIDSPSSCPVAHVSSTTGATCNSISMATAGDPNELVTEEFMLDAEVPPDALEALNGSEPVEVFSYGSKHTYRFDRTREDCACERIQLFDCPVSDVYAREGVLFVTFHTEGMDQLRGVLSELRGDFAGVTVKRLLHSNMEDHTSDLVLLDRSELTDRQREVLETAHDMGYFEHGQGANAGEVAEALDINTSTFSEHLRAAQRKLLRTILDR